MPSPNKPPRPKGQGGYHSAVQRPPRRRKRLAGRKIVAFGILLVLPLVLIVGVLGSIGKTSNSKSNSASGAVPGLDLMTQACSQLSTLAQNAGAVGTTTTTVAGANGANRSPSTTVDNSAAASNLLAGMSQVAQLAANAAGTSSAWQPMATDISKLNDMIQSDTGDAASFSTQLQTVGQECSAVVGSTPTATTG